MTSDAPILVTGAAGFVGFHTAARLLKEGLAVVGLDNLNDYYDVRLKKARLQELAAHPKFRFHPIDLKDAPGLKALFQASAFERIIHLAAQAGVRYSATRPEAYVQSNLEGFVNLLEACRLAPVKHLTYASSSSVYGLHTPAAYREDDRTDQPLSLYGATKKANEAIAYAYAHLYKIPMTGLRFFTVYGPWGRPDMAYFSFTKAILEGKPLPLFGDGSARRDYTFADDCVEAIWRLFQRPPASEEGQAPHRLFNIGNDRPVSTLELISLLETLLGKKASIEHRPVRPEDVPETHADVTALEAATGFRPRTDLKKGLERFVEWYKNFYPKV